MIGTVDLRPPQQLAAQSAHAGSQGAEEFRAVKRAREDAGSTAGRAAEQEAAKKRRGGVAFGTGALEETDTFGYVEDYVTMGEDGRQRNEVFAFEVASDDEDAPAGCVPICAQCHRMLDAQTGLYGCQSNTSMVSRCDNSIGVAACV